MAKMAGVIRVHLGRDGFCLDINGELFEWRLDESHGVIVSVVPDELPSVIVRIPAERVEVDHEVG